MIMKWIASEGIGAHNMHHDMSIEVELHPCQGSQGGIELW